MSWFRRDRQDQGDAAGQHQETPLGLVTPLPTPQMPFWMPELLERRAKYQAELATKPAPPTFVAPGYEWTLTTPWIDPADSVTPGSLAPYRTRLTASPPDGWVAASTVTAQAPLRQRTDPDGRLNLLDERPLKATAVRVRRHSLEPATSPAPLLDRLRALHTRLLPAPDISGSDGRASPWFPVNARQITLTSGQAGIEDSFAELPGGEPTAWQISVSADEPEGLVACVGGSAERRTGAVAASVMLGCLGLHDLDDPGFSWAIPADWSVVERLQLASGTLDAHATLESLPDGWGHDDWVRLSFDRAPFLRDRRQLGRRPVQVRGMGDGEMLRFDWQPSGRGRLLTSVAWAVRDRLGFMFTLEVSLDAGDLVLTDPDELLAAVSVR